MVYVSIEGNLEVLQGEGGTNGCGSIIEMAPAESIGQSGAGVVGPQQIAAQVSGDTADFLPRGFAPDLVRFHFGEQPFEPLMKELTLVDRRRILAGQQYAQAAGEIVSVQTYRQDKQKKTED